MDEMFKKLDGYETIASDKLSEWDKLEAILPTKRKKRIVWLWIVPTIITLWFFNQYYNTSIERSNDTSLNNSINNNIVSNRQKSLNIKSKNYTSGKVDIKSENIITEINSKNSNSTKIDVLNDKKMSNLTFVASEELLNKSINQLRIDSCLEISQLEYLSFNKVYLIPENQITSDPFFVLTPIEHKLKPKGRFTLYAGIRTSLLNRLSNLDVTELSYTFGGLIQLDYETSKLLGLSLKCGFQTEYNHDLNYSYISDKEVFFQKSERINNIHLKQLSTINSQLSVLFNWTPKHVSSIGGYYSHTIQSRSDVSVIGSGKYSDVNKQSLRQKNYHDLVNSMDVGIYLSHSYRLHPSWLISLEFFIGSNNRLNNSYFNNQYINRKEISLSIFKKI